MKLGYSEYRGAEIYFPEWFDTQGIEFKEDTGTITNDEISFSLGKFLVNARIRRSHVKTIEPIIEQVESDIETIEDLLAGEFRRFAGEGKLPYYFSYIRDVSSGRWFGVHDQMESKPFDALKKGAVEGDELKKIQRSIYQSEGKPAFVAARTLRRATERALTIYRAALESKI